MKFISGIAVLLLAAAQPASAQLHIAVKGSGAWTSVEELDKAYGVELSLTNLVTRQIGWSMAYSSHWNNGDGFGSACTGLIPPGEDCSERPLEVERSMEFFSIMLMVRPVNYRGWTFDLGAGPAKHKFDYEEREPDTGRRSGVESDSWFRGMFKDLSLAGTAVLTRNNLFKRVGLQASVSAQKGEMKTCIIDGASLCDDYTALKASFGLSYSFPIR